MQGLDVYIVVAGIIFGVTGIEAYLEWRRRNRHGLQ